MNKFSIIEELSSLRSNLFKPRMHGGIWMRRIIDNILTPLTVKISKDSLLKIREPLMELIEDGRVNEREFDTIMGIKRIEYQNGDWHPANKLNTNYSEQSELIYDVMEKEGMIDDLVDAIQSGKSNLIDFLIKSDLETLIRKHYEPEDLLTYTNNITKYSKYGSAGEASVVDDLKKHGWDILYRGEDGCPIDMVLYTDIIAINPAGVLKTIQVKPNLNFNPLYDSRYEKIDIIATFHGGIEYYCNRTKKKEIV